MLYHDYILFGILLFFGGFVDSIAGGGGLITVPAYMSLGIPIDHVMGTNKFSSSLATLSSFVKYSRSKKLQLGLLVKLVPFSFLGSCCGVLLFYMLDPNFLKRFIPFIIMGVCIYSLFSRDFGMVEGYKPPSHKELFKGGLLVFLIGLYDGFIGPGTGIFFTILFIKYFKLDFLGAAGGARLLNFVAGITAFVLYGVKGAVIFKLGLFGFLFSFAGSFLGTHLAVKSGAKFIKPIFITISFLLALKLFISPSN